MTWTLTQTNTAVTGPALLTLSSGIVLMNGTFAGTLVGTDLTYTITIAPGGVPLQPACTGQLGGTMTATTPVLLSGTYRVITSTCTTGLTNGTFTMSKL